MTIDEAWDELNGWHEQILLKNGNHQLASVLRINKWGGWTQYFAVFDESGKNVGNPTESLSAAIRILCEASKK